MPTKLDTDRSGRKFRPRHERHKLAMGRLIGHDSRFLAGRVGTGPGLSERTVRSWGDPRDLDHRGPNLLLRDLMDAAEEIGRDEEDVLAPIEELLRERGRMSVPLPDGLPYEIAEMPNGLAALFESIAEAAREAAVAIKDGHVTAEEYRRYGQAARLALRELQKMQVSLMALHDRSVLG